MDRTSINRRHFFLGATGAALAGAAGCARPAPGPAESAPRQTPLDGDLSAGNKLNLIVVCADTTRADHLEPYGSTHCKTPNIAAFAEQSAVFENSYADALPTLPCRRVMNTGNSILSLKSRWWAPLREDDVTLAMVLKKAGYTTGLVTDIFHYFKPGMNYHQAFDSFEFLRGQETDAWVSGVPSDFDPSQHMPAHHVDDRYRAGMAQYVRNTEEFAGEDDYFCAQTMKAAMTWLDRSAKQSPFFLWIDSFDPHEPWDPPANYAKLYREDYGYERYLFGYPITPSKIRPEDYPVIRDLYAAEVTYMDRWVGNFLAKLDAMKLLDNTVVAFISDHGTHLGEEDCVQKTPGLITSAMCRLPLIVRHPDQTFAGKRSEQMCSPLDYAPTFLSLLGYDGLPGMEGGNFWKLLEDGSPPLRDTTYMGYGAYAGVRTKDWHYFQHWRGEEPGKGPALYDVHGDPNETTNLAADHAPEVAELRGLIGEHFEAEMPAVEPHLS